MHKSVPSLARTILDNMRRKQAQVVMWGGIDENKTIVLTIKYSEIKRLLGRERLREVVLDELIGYLEDGGIEVKNGGGRFLTLTLEYSPDETSFDSLGDLMENVENRSEVLRLTMNE
jgi:hypothetical protein